MDLITVNEDKGQMVLISNENRSILCVFSGKEQNDGFKGVCSEQQGNPSLSRNMSQDGRY